MSAICNLNSDLILCRTKWNGYVVVPGYNVDVAPGILRDGIIEPWTTRLVQEFLKRGISPSAFSPVDDVDRNMRSKNVEDIDNAMKKLGDIHQLSGGIKGIYNRRKNEYTGLIKNGQFVDLYSRGGLSQDELKLHGGSIDSWLDHYNKTFSSGSLQLSWKPITEELISNLSQYSAFRNFAGGFIPNFAYKQAVMSLEEGMSGQKAIFDTKPFPHIRNASQPTFSSAVADHGGLSNALSDSMRGQKAAGLMANGSIPNFAAPNPITLTGSYAKDPRVEQAVNKYPLPRHKQISY